MSGSLALRNEWAPRILSIVRIAIGLLFLEHGTQKLLGFPPSASPGPAMFTLMWFAGLIELVGGALVTLGLFTRAAAFVMSGEMAFAFFIAHFPQNFFPVNNRGDAAVLYCFIFLYFAVAGGGCWSLDAALSGDRRR